MNVRGYHEVVAGLDQFCGEVITSAFAHTQNAPVKL